MRSLRFVAIVVNIRITETAHVFSNNYSAERWSSFESFEVARTTV